MTQPIVKHHGGSSGPPTVLGQGPARIPTGGKIRAGTKALPARPRTSDSW